MALRAINANDWNISSVQMSSGIVLLRCWEGVGDKVTTHKLGQTLVIYERHLESKERFAIKKYLLIIGKKKNMQVLSHIFTYFST